MSYRGGRYSSSSRRGNNNFRNSGRRDSGNSTGFRERTGGRSRDFDSRRRVGSDDRRRDDFKRSDDRNRRDSFGSSSSRGMKRKFRDQSPRRRSNNYGRNDSKDFRRRGLDRPNRGSDRRFGLDRRGSHQSNERNSSSNRHRSRSGNSDRVKMPPPKNPPRNIQRRRGGIRPDTKMSLVHKRLAEKHAARGRAREVINKRIKMAKMRSTLNQRRRTTKLGTRLATMKKIKTPGKGNTGAARKVVTKNKKQSESADKDTADEMWDDDEKQIHEEEMRAKKAAEALHESNSGDDGTKKSSGGEKTAVKIKRERTESASEQDTSLKSLSADPQKRIPINLTCVHCKSKCQTSMEYKVHLDGLRHRAAMSKISSKQKQQLQRMRQEQRNAQKEADEGLEKDARSKHCQLCRLFYKQTKEEHQQSEDHKNIKKFLMPFCHVCKIGYKSPMSYETHRSSMHHLRSKARYERCGKIPEDEETELDLDNFTTVDEVGEIDGDDENYVENQADEQHDHQEFSDEEESCDINVGSEHIKQVQVYYCELCSMYVSHHGDQEKSLSRHCILRSHLRNYIRYKDDKALQAEAEALHKKRKAERELKEKQKVAKENGDAKHEKEDEITKDSTDEQLKVTVTEDDSMATESLHAENGDLLDVSIKKEKDDSFNNQEEDEGVTA